MGRPAAEEHDPGELSRPLWDLSCRDWESRIREGRSLVPALPLFPGSGETAVRIFDRLRLADVVGTPTMAEAGGDWFRDIIRALFGSLDPATRERMIREVFLLVPKKNSKMLALDTPLATPTGFTTMGAVQVGELVLDADGRATRVTEKSPVFIGRECFEVEFSTSEKVIAGDEHLWVTDAHRDRESRPMTRKEKASGARKRPAPSVKSTAEIAATLKVPSGKYVINNHRTALCGALDLPDAEMPIPPYVLGAWLGDGTASAATITAGAADAEHMVAAIAGVGHSARLMGYHQSGAARISIAEPGGAGARLPYRFRTAARKLGVLGNKHIPDLYLRGSYAQRLELLRGLMDTDGMMTKRGQASYSTTLPALRDGVIELVNSLGLKASASEFRSKLNGRDYGPVWNVQFWPFREVEIFTLPRKLERQRASAARNSARSRTRQIVAVRPVPSVPTQCIAVESETHQYLVTRSLIPTHNTTNGALLMLTALLLNQRPNAPFILTAPVQDVSEIAFAAVAGAIALDPVLEKKLHVREHIKTIVHRETKAELQIMTFDPSVLTGQKAVGILIDELHVVSKMSKAASAVRQLRGGMLPFPEAFLAFITTQSEEQPAGVFRAELMKAREIRDGRREGAMLPVLYEFPESMQRDRDAWRDPANWPMVTPNAGRSISIPRLVQEMRVAEATSDEELRSWASQHLDLEIGLAMHSDTWVGATYWETCRRVELEFLEELVERSEVIVAGIDGGGLDDMFGLCVLGREIGTGTWLVWIHVWIHPIVLERRKSEAPKFLDFRDEGDLTLVEVVGQDVEQAADILKRLDATGLLDQVGVDQAGIGALVDALVDRDIELERIVGIPQGWKLTSAIKTAERKLAGRGIAHGGRSLMAWCVGNARVEPRGNAVIITKQTSGAAKIDPLMALFDAVALMAMNPQPRSVVPTVFFV